MVEAITQNAVKLEYETGTIGSGLKHDYVWLTIETRPRLAQD